MKERDNGSAEKKKRERERERNKGRRRKVKRVWEKETDPKNISMFQPQKYKIILRVDQTEDIYEGVTKVLIKGTRFETQAVYITLCDIPKQFMSHCVI